jgi:hypothetical protein
VRSEPPDSSRTGACVCIGARGGRPSQGIGIEAQRRAAVPRVITYLQENTFYSFDLEKNTFYSFVPARDTHSIHYVSGVYK